MQPLPFLLHKRNHGFQQNTLGAHSLISAKKLNIDCQFLDKNYSVFSLKNSVLGLDYYTFVSCEMTKFLEFSQQVCEQLACPISSIRLGLTAVQPRVKNFPYPELHCSHPNRTTQNCTSKPVETNPGKANWARSLEPASLSQCKLNSAGPGNGAGGPAQLCASLPTSSVGTSVPFCLGCNTPWLSQETGAGPKALRIML